MLYFTYLVNGLGIISPPHFVYDFREERFLCYILLTDQILLTDCLYSLRYWSIFLLQLSVNQVVTS